MPVTLNRGILLALLAASTLGLGLPTLRQTAQAAEVGNPTGTDDSPALVALPDFTPLIHRYGPAVVNISSTTIKVVNPDMGHNPFPPDSPFYHFFHHFFGQPNGQVLPQQEKMESLGTGFIISPNGYIVTAAHVVRGASHVLVSLTDHHTYPAKLVGLSVRYDTALLKINATNLPTVPIGNSSDLQVGQWVLAVGAPFGFYNTVTQGVVSAVKRPLPDDEYIPFIQSDVPINPGNSGGPLFNMQGQVVGINDQIYTSSGGYMGLSFSIPINTAMRVVNALEAHKPIRFGWLGVEVQDVSEQMAKAMHMKEPVGALVANVVPNGPAAKGGLKAGDVIVTFDNTPIYSVGQLPPIVGDTLPGTHASVGVLRDGKPETLQITVGNLPKVLQTAAVHSGQIPKLDIQAQRLTPEAMKQMDIRHGVLVLAVAAGPAQEAGIAPGEVIQQVGQQDVTSPAQLRTIVAALPGGAPIPVLVRKGRESMYVVVTLPSS